MELFATDLERLGFLAQGETELRLAVSGEFVPGVSLAEAPETDARHGNQKPADRPKYITNYIGPKQKLVDRIWWNTPQDVKSVVDVFSGSAVVAYMFKMKGLRVIANDRLHYCHHAARVFCARDGQPPEAIDAALRRPGRFDRVVCMKRPNNRSRTAILAHYLEPLRLAPDLNAAELAVRLASATTGASGADLEHLCLTPRESASRRRSPGPPTPFPSSAKSISDRCYKSVSPAPGAASPRPGHKPPISPFHPASAAPAP